MSFPFSRSSPDSNSTFDGISKDFPVIDLFVVHFTQWKWFILQPRNEKYWAKVKSGGYITQVHPHKVLIELQSELTFNDRYLNISVSSVVEI